MTDGILPPGLRFRGKLIWLAGHLTPLSGLPAHPADARASGIRPPPAHQPLPPQSARAPQSSSSDTDEAPSRATRPAEDHRAAQIRPLGWAGLRRTDSRT